MNRIFHVAGWLMLMAGLLATGLLPAGAQAQTTGTETVVIKVDVTTPSGTKVMGTVVARRQCGSPTTTELSFNGMINGYPATATAMAVERWSGDSSAQIEINQITQWEAPVGRPNPITLNIVQTAPGLVTVNGVPVAIDGTLKAPCGGRTTYTVTNPGKGGEEIVLLPSTGQGPFFAHPLVIVGMLVTPGILLVLVSSLLNRWNARHKA